MSGFSDPMKWHTELDVTPPTGEVENMELDPGGETTDEDTEEEGSDEEDAEEEKASPSVKRSQPTPTSPTSSDRPTKVATRRSRA